MQECFVYLASDRLSKVIHMHYGYRLCWQSLRELTCINLIWTYENCIVADPSVLGVEHWLCVYLTWYSGGDKGGRNHSLLWGYPGSEQGEEEGSRRSELTLRIQLVELPVLAYNMVTTSTYRQLGEVFIDMYIFC